MKRGRGPVFFFRERKIVFPSDAEEIADALADIKADLDRKPVTDPRVWSGYPWPPDADDEDIPQGLFEQLVRCTRGTPTEQMARAIRIAFELGQASIVGEADHDVVERTWNAMERTARGRLKGGKKTGSKIRAGADEPCAS